MFGDDTCFSRISRFYTWWFQRWSSCDLYLKHPPFSTGYFCWNPLVFNGPLQKPWQKTAKKNPGKYGKSLTFFTKKAFSDFWHNRKLWRKGDFWSFGDFRNCSITHPKWVGSCWTAFLLGHVYFASTHGGPSKTRFMEGFVQFGWGMKISSQLDHLV